MITYTTQAGSGTSISAQDPKAGDVFEYLDRSGCIVIGENSEVIQISPDGSMALYDDFALDTPGRRADISLMVRSRV